MLSALLFKSDCISLFYACLNAILCGFKVCVLLQCIKYTNTYAANKKKGMPLKHCLLECILKFLDLLDQYCQLTLTHPS